LSAGPADDPLPIRSLVFAGGMATPGGWRPEPDRPEVAFSGRSNVGKSSLLNRLVRRRSLARVSNTPGRTREINFFRVNDALVLVDLPGYGYSRQSKAQRALWRPLVEGYLRSSPQLRGVVQLLDVRRDPTPDDVEVLDLLADVGVPVLLVVTKTDKLTRAASERRVADIATLLSVDQDAIVPVSSETGAGRDELAQAIVALVTQQSWRGGDPGV
jgi:GTP-binding protein